MNVFSFLLADLTEEPACNLSVDLPATAAIARSLPTAVPDSSCVPPGFTPRTPRTPRLQDPSRTPRFYPVVKEAQYIDVKVKGKIAFLFWWFKPEKPYKTHVCEYDLTRIKWQKMKPSYFFYCWDSKRLSYSSSFISCKMFSEFSVMFLRSLCWKMVMSKDFCYIRLIF